MGLMQLSPSIIQAYGVRNPMDPRENIFAGARLLAENLDRYRDPVMAIQAYHGGTDQANWGPRTRTHLLRVSQLYQQGGQLPEAPGGAQQPGQQPGANVQPTVPGQGTPPVAPQQPSAAELDNIIFGPGGRPPARPELSEEEQMEAINRLLNFGTTNSGQVPRRESTPPDQRPGAFGRLSAGVVRGIRDVIDMPAELMARGSDAIGLTPWLRNGPIGRAAEELGLSGIAFPPVLTGTEQAASNAQDRRAFDEEFGDSGLATAGRIVGNVAGVTPAMGVLGNTARAAGYGASIAAPRLAASVAPVATAVAGATTPANPLLRAGSRAAGGAVAGVASQGMMLDPDQPAVPQLLQGAAVGAGVNAAVLPAARTLGRTVSAPFRANVTPEDAALATRATQLGVPVRGSQMGSPATRITDSLLLRTPGTGHNQRTAQQMPAFTRAVAQSFGENADTLNPQVFANARRRIGGQLDDAATRTPTYQADGAFSSQLQALRRDIDMSLDEGSATPVRRFLDHVEELLTNPNNAGRTYQSLTRSDTPLGRLRESNDPNIAHYGRRIKDMLDDLLERQAPPGVVPQIRQARSQWRAMSAVENTVGADGFIEVNRFFNAIRNAYGNPATRPSGNDLGDLALIARRFLQMPGSSNTTEYQTVRNLMGAIGSLIPNAVLMHDPTAAAATAGTLAGVAAGGNLLSRYFNSPGYRDRMIRAGMAAGQQSGGSPMGRFIDATAVPAGVSASDQDWTRTPDDFYRTR